MSGASEQKSGKVDFIGVVQEEASKVTIFPEFCAGLKGLENFSHIIILYWFHLRDHKKERQTLKVVPRRHLGAPEVGVFSCRSPSRPNPIGLSVVELVEIKGCTLIVKGLDAMDGSPIVDIKPYMPRSESIPNARAPEWTDHGSPT